MPRLDTGDLDIRCPGPNCPLGGAVQAHVRSSSPLWLWLDWLRPDGKVGYAVYTQEHLWSPTQTLEVPGLKADEVRNKLRESMDGLEETAVWADPTKAATRIREEVSL